MKISILILAAGKSTRMGDANKLLLPINSTTILQNTLNQIENLNPYQKIVVTGFQADLTKPLIDSSKFKIIHNPNFEDGMTSSIQTGIEALDKNSIGVMIVPGDMAYPDAGIFEQVIEQFLRAYSKNPKTIAAPTELGVQKNPVIFSAYYYPEILSHKNKNGCKEIVQNHTKHVTSVEIAIERFFQDIDTPEDYQKRLNETTE